MSKKLIDEMIADLLQEKKVKTIKEEVGGVETNTTQESSSAFGMSLKELTSIIAVGTETDKVLQSSDAALTVFKKNVNVQFDYSSASSIANSFNFLDFSDEMVLKERCESLGGLMSKMSLVSGLVSIKSQFNAQAGGFVNEAYIAKLMDGKTVSAGDGGVEDISVDQGGKRVGISLKVKKAERLQGSFVNLCETLSIPIKKQATVNSEKKSGINRIKPIRTGGTFGKTEVTSQSLSSRKRMLFVKPPENVINNGGLYYVNFVGGGESLTVLVNKIAREDVIGSATPDENGFYDINKLSNVLEMKTPVTKDMAKYQFKSKFGVKEYNKIMEVSLKEVYGSLTKLDAWFGDLKVVLAKYVSTLEFDEYDLMQKHLSQGASFAFKAFDLSSCETKQMQEQKETKLELEDIDNLIAEAIRDIKKK